MTLVKMSLAVSPLASMSGLELINEGNDDNGIHSLNQHSNCLTTLPSHSCGWLSLVVHATHTTGGVPDVRTMCPYQQVLKQGNRFPLVLFFILCQPCFPFKCMYSYTATQVLYPIQLYTLLPALLKRFYSEELHMNYILLLSYQCSLCPWNSLSV